MQRHHATIEHEYVNGVFYWRVVCNCGFKGNQQLRPRLAEGDLEHHIRVDDARPKTMTAGG